MIAARRARLELRARRALEQARRARPAAGRARGAARRLSVGERPAAPVRRSTAWPTTRAAFAAPASATSPYVEPTPGAGKGLLAALAARRVVVTDDFPASSCRGWSPRRRARLRVRLEAVDGNGLLPLRAADRAFPTALRVPPPPAAHARRASRARARGRSARAAASRRAAGAARRRCRALAATPPRWRRSPRPAGAPADRPRGRAGRDARRRRGGAGPARGLRRRRPRPLRRATRNQPDATPAAGCRPTCTSVTVGRTRCSRAVRGARAGLGAMPAQPAPARATAGGATPAAEAFLDQLVTWRELGFNMCAHRPDYDRVRVAARLGARHARAARRRSARRTSTRSTSSTGARDPRPAVERGAAPARARRAHPQLPAHAVGQEDPRVVGDAAGGAGDA